MFVGGTRLAHSNYSDDSIQILEGLDAVRKRPGMYIGSTDARGLHHLVYEITDNAVDEIINGYGNKIEITINKNGSITVSDNGRGLPTGMHQSGKSTPEVIFTILHAGGKFGSGGYKTSGGLHGVGASVVNALSEWLELEICRDGKRYSMSFKNGGEVDEPLKEIGNTNQTGTRVTFKPDRTIFKTGTQFNFETIVDRMRESAFLEKNLEVSITDLNTDKHELFHYEDGLLSFINFLHEGKENFGSPIAFSGNLNGMQADVAFQYNDQYTETVMSFVNNVRTKDGGTHEVGFKSSFTRIFNDFARKIGELKDKDKNLEGNDIREGLTAVISVKIPEELLQFEGQTKGKLGTPEARQLMDHVLSENLPYILEENGVLSAELVKKAIKARQVRVAARKAREEMRNGKKSKRRDVLLSGKLTPAQSKNRKKNELFLVEGDSAGGSAKLGRDRKFQAILPLRGKVINTERARFEDIFKNEEINTIIHTIGAGVGNEFDIDQVNYDKVIIMTDADTDGAHIQVLLLTFFFNYMRPLLHAGKVYIALPPLFKLEKKRGKKQETRYVWTEEELEEMKEELGDNVEIQRYKGLGEMMADQLWETTMDPENRTLIQVLIDDEALSLKRVSTLMGDNVEIRRDWIEENVSFTLEDDASILDSDRIDILEDGDSYA
ncbi:DNA topoisomerase IV subunit B [Nosocomiicoccus sp. HMSC059G07]|uniref:DNA topoisomerase IV subunit B n=1 Tax=Nosocomiicoccus sp. HMSC059G07 TaxID=1739531 RepID=UPI0008A33B57|nr:DNA topoisomerase IV subunit B [Nosocomiicoccus sp. HMSC059G07]OFO55588.1 DNA topoisomerase IV subunit B [Nosocomiicoccus sp. HMSC059G07]